jgi:hypothetical protein
LTWPGRRSSTKSAKRQAARAAHRTRPTPVLTEAGLQRENQLEQQFQETMDEFGAKFRCGLGCSVRSSRRTALRPSGLGDDWCRYKTVQPQCATQQTQVQNCLKEHPNRPLNCDGVVAQFLACAQHTKKVGRRLLPPPHFLAPRPPFA